MGISVWQLQVQCAVLKHPSFKLPAFWEGMLSVSRSLRVTMWCLLVLYYFICHILLCWCLLSFKVLSKCHFSSVISSDTQCKQESWLQDEVRGISLPDTRGQDASKKLLQCLSEAVCFKGSFWTETFPFFALEALSWSLAACWRAKCHTEQGVISHCALRVESGTTGSLKVGELREKGVCVIYNVERVLHLCFVRKKLVGGYHLNHESEAWC